MRPRPFYHFVKFFSTLAKLLVKIQLSIFFSCPVFGEEGCLDLFRKEARPEVKVRFGIGKSSSIRRLLAIVAMGVEEAAILKSLGTYEEFVISSSLGITAKIFRKMDKELLLVTSGIGNVYAGMTTALVADKFQIDGVILFGVAGALKQGLEIGQLVIASRVIQHDSIYSGESGIQLMAPGAPFVSVNPDARENPVFETDPRFRKWLLNALQGNSKVKFIEGTLLSGSEFVGSAIRKRAIGSTQQDSLAVEMEAAGIAVVVRRLNLPFAVLKTVADRLNPDQSISNDYNQFIQGAAENAGGVMDVIWKSWIGDE